MPPAGRLQSNSTAAPAKIAASATLKAKGFAMPQQLMLMKSATAPQRSRSQTLPSAPPIMAPAPIACTQPPVRRTAGRGPAAGVGLIVGGALGNVWDRLTWGAVADFINMSCCGIRNPFAFYVADAAIIGVGFHF